MEWSMLASPKSSCQAPVSIGEEGDQEAIVEAETKVDASKDGAGEIQASKDIWGQPDGYQNHTLMDNW